MPRAEKLTRVQPMEKAILEYNRLKNNPHVKHVEEAIRRMVIAEEIWNPRRFMGNRLHF